MTLICNKCGQLKDREDLQRHRDFVGYIGDMPVYERWLDITCSCGGTYQKAEQCDCCEDYVLETYGYGKKRVCKDCLTPFFTTKNIEAWARGEDVSPEENLDSFADFCFRELNFL